MFWVEKEIHRELCKKFTFDHTVRWYMHKAEPVLENETHKILRDFEIQTDSPKKRKKTCRIVDSPVPAGNRMKIKENEKKKKKKKKYLDLATELKN